MLLSKHRHYISAAILACFGVVLNRFVLTIQTLALPTLPFDEFMRYVPSWQECGVFLGVIAYAVIVYSLSYRYLKLFPEQPAPSPAESPRDLVSLDLVVQR
jgi:molybdopterin-containing oxidoreductase family membrane subunit